MLKADTAKPVFTQLEQLNAQYAELLNHSVLGSFLRDVAENGDLFTHLLDYRIHVPRAISVMANGPKSTRQGQELYFYPCQLAQLIITRKSEHLSAGNRHHDWRISEDKQAEPLREHRINHAQVVQGGFPKLLELVQKRLFAGYMTLSKRENNLAELSEYEQRIVLLHTKYFSGVSGTSAENVLRDHSETLASLLKEIQTAEGHKPVQATKLKSVPNLLAQASEVLFAGGGSKGNIRSLVQAKLK